MPTINAGKFEINYIEEGEGFPIFLIHGLVGDHTAWIPQVNVLKKKYRMIAIDNPGSGKSSPVTSPCTTEELADTMLIMLDNLGIDKAHVLGRSLGGLIGQHMALRGPDLVHSLVMTAATPKVDPIGKRLLENMREILEWRDNWSDWARHAAHTFVTPQFYNENPEAMSNIVSLISNEELSKVSYINLNQTALAHDTTDQLKDIICPTLIMAGRLDPICSMVGTDAMTSSIQNAETVIFEKSSHFFMIEEAEKSMNTLIDWFSRHTP